MGTIKPVGSIGGRIRDAMRRQGYNVADGQTGAPTKSEKGFTQKDLADKAHMQGSALSKYLDGSKDDGNFAVALAQLRDLADALEESFEWIALGRRKERDEIREIVREEVQDELGRPRRDSDLVPAPDRVPSSSKIPSHRPRG